MTDDLASAAGAVAPVSEMTPTQTQSQPATVQVEDDFDENLIPPGSRDNFKKYRESQKAKAEKYEQSLNEATRRAYEAEARAQEYERKNQQPVDLKDIGERPKRPTLDDPNIKTMDDYNKALDKYDQEMEAWAEKKGVVQHTKRLTTEQQQRIHEQAVAKIRAKGQQAAQKYQDFSQTVKPFLNVASQMPVLDQFTQESDAGMDVLYHLCKNPALFDSLTKMTPFAAGKELIRLEGVVNSQPQPKQTKAPPPMKPVGAGDGNVSTLIDLTKKDDVTEFVKRSNREELRKRRGN